MDVSNEAPDWKAPNKKMNYAIESFWKPSKFKPETISIETGSGSDESSFDTSVEYITDSESESDDEDTYKDLQHAQSKRKAAYNQYRKWLKEEKKVKEVLLKKYSKGKDGDGNSPWSTGYDDAQNYRRNRPCYYVAIKGDCGRMKVPQSKMAQEEKDEYSSGFAYGRIQRKPKKK